MRRNLPIILSVLLAGCSPDAVAPLADAPARTPSADVQATLNRSKNSANFVIWGDNSAQQITDAPVNEDIKAIAPGGARQGLVIRHDGSLFLWGSVGVPSTVPQPMPAALANDEYESAYLALSTLYAIRKNHSVVSWGNFLGGTPATPPAGLKARQVAGGSTHGVAIEVSGGLVTWGSGPAVLVAPPEGKFTEVAARTIYSIALRKDGTLVGWGGGQFAADIFNGWMSDGAGHVFVPGERFVAIAAGNQHILALRANGTVVGWGKNTFQENIAPANVRFAAIAAGLNYSIGLTDDGTIRQWGDASNGTGNVPPGRFVSIAAGARQASALRDDEHGK
ncbi:MAG: hypothetical protein ABIT20_18245 [Gemmatimonadaceae bacterium]